MSSQRLPPLQLLPSFEAASRLLSFSKAASELHITTSAVSQQIKQLEEHLGLKLFHRLTRRLELTEAGKKFATVATQTLSTYRQGHAELMYQNTRAVVRMSMSPLVAYELFLPRLAAFQEAFPQVDLRLEASMELANFDHDGIDAAIRFGSGRWAGLESLLLCECQAAIVASPELSKRVPVHSLADLQHHVLIHPRQSHLDWDALAKAIKVETIARKSDLMLDSDLASLKAAEQGLGVAFCILPSMGDWLLSKRLVPLIPPIRLPLKAYFVFRTNSVKRGLLMSACQWIKENVLQPPG